MASYENGQVDLNSTDAFQTAEITARKLENDIRKEYPGETGLMTYNMHTATLVIMNANKFTVV